MRLTGLGSSLPSGFPHSDACGDNPCTWWDDIYARDACITFLECAYPNDPTTIGFEQGALVGAGAAAGQAVGGTVSAAGTGLITGLTGGDTTTAPGGVGGVSWALIGGAAALLAVIVLTRK
jgi:hypothetical protein